MHLTHHAHVHAVDAHLGAAAGMVAGVVLHGGVFRFLQPQTGEDGFQLALQGEEGLAGAVGAENQHLRLLGQRLTGHRQIDFRQLVELHGLVMVGVVPGEDFQHGGQGDGAHDGGVLAQRILDAQSVAQGRIGGQPDLIENGGGDEGIGDDLAVAHGAAQGSGLGFQLHHRGIAALGRGLEGGSGNLVVAVGTTHFLGDIRHQVQVGTEGGNENGVALHGNFQPVQVLDHVLLGDIGTQQPVDFLRLQRQRLFLRDIVDDIDGAVQHIAAAQHLHKLAGTLHGRDGHHGVKALFKFAGGFGAHTQRQSGLADGGAVEVGGLEDYHGGIVLDFGVFAAHDTGKADGLIFVGDDQHTGFQVAHIAVQRGQGLAVLGFPHHDLAGRNIAVIKGVHGLTVFQHDVVGDVHDVIDGTHAVGAQTAAQPLGGGGDLYVGNHPGGVAVAQLRCGDVHVQMVVNIPGVGAVNHRLVVTHGLAEGGGSFPGKADDAVAVGAVVGDLKIHNGVVVADDEVDVLANRAVLVIEDPDAVGEHAGQVVLSQSQLSEGAEHTVGRFAPELALGDVNAAGEP